MYRRIYHALRRIFKRNRTPVANRLSPEARAKVAAEAAFLAGHGVSVHELAIGERAGKPHAADPKVEAELMASQE